MRNETRLDKEFRKKLSKTSIQLGPWVTADQHKDFPSGCARFFNKAKKASMDFIEALALLDVLNDVDDINDIWPIIKNFSDTSTIEDMWKK